MEDGVEVLQLHFGGMGLASAQGICIEAGKGSQAGC